ncbi:proline-rich membrane anchor 1 [Silurus asotus]|uniref:Proline-rich membrane anchor 1 n=1 Tax=Silurus asotus TaxID=30991 RepID=A0AAD5AEC1_SILAS|nr:proline-rich membrane anchor 1 [Silurus asotus]
MMNGVVQSAAVFLKTPQSFTVAPSSVSPPVKSWGREVEILVLGTVSCASVIFFFLTVIICYKAIKRKPLRKEENGTSRGEYAMSSRCKQTAVETNNTGV